MRELILTMIRFSSAVTMFGFEQMQNAISAPADTKTALTKLCDSLDAMSESLGAKLDDPKKSALDSMSKAQVDILDRTSRAFNLDTVLNLDTASDLLKKTSESLATVVNGSGRTRAAGAA